MPRRTQRRAPQQTGATTVALRERRPGGRPPVVSDGDRVTAMLRAVEAGVPITVACDHARIPQSAHFRAMDAGEDAQAKADDGHPLTRREVEYREYRERVIRARARVAVEHAALIGKAAHGGALLKETTYRNDDGQLVTEREYARPEWQASKFMLQASFRADFQTGPLKSSVEVTGADGGPIEVHHSEEIVLTLAERLHTVAQRHQHQLPGGWDPEDAEEAELVDEGTEIRGDR